MHTVNKHLFQLKSINIESDISILTGFTNAFGHKQYEDTISNKKIANETTVPICVPCYENESRIAIHSCYNCSISFASIHI